MSSTPLNIKDNQQGSTTFTKSTHNTTTNKQSILSFIITATLLFGAVFLLRSYIVKPFIVQGVSMYPTFDNWHYLIIDQATYNFYREPQRGEVVVFHAPGTSQKYFIKRVIGLPGETVRINGQIVSIETLTGKTITLKEPYIIDSKRKDAQINIKLNDNEYYMLGDNRLESADSRYWGPLKRDKIVGRAILRLFPINKVDWMPGDYKYK